VVVLLIEQYIIFTGWLPLRSTLCPFKSYFEYALRAHVYPSYRFLVYITVPLTPHITHSFNRDKTSLSVVTDALHSIHALCLTATVYLPSNNVPANMLYELRKMAKIR
jgi:hypothetical protein